MLVKIFDLKSFITTEITFFIDADWDRVKLYLSSTKTTRK